MCAGLRGAGFRLWVPSATVAPTRDAFHRVEDVELSTFDTLVFLGAPGALGVLDFLGGGDCFLAVEALSRAFIHFEVQYVFGAGVDPVLVTRLVSVVAKRAKSMLAQVRCLGDDQGGVAPDIAQSAGEDFDLSVVAVANMKGAAACQ